MGHPGFQLSSKGNTHRTIRRFRHQNSWLLHHENSREQMSFWVAPPGLDSISLPMVFGRSLWCLELSSSVPKIIHSRLHNLHKGLSPLLIVWFQGAELGPGAIPMETGELPLHRWLVPRSQPILWLAPTEYGLLVMRRIKIVVCRKVLQSSYLWALGEKRVFSGWSTARHRNPPRALFCLLNLL